MIIDQADQDIPLDHSSFCKIELSRREVLVIQHFLKEMLAITFLTQEENVIFKKILGVIAE